MLSSQAFNINMMNCEMSGFVPRNWEQRVFINCHFWAFLFIDLMNSNFRSDELLAEADEDVNLPDEQILYGAEDEEYDEEDDDEMYEEDETYDDDRN